MDPAFFRGLFGNSSRGPLLVLAAPALFLICLGIIAALVFRELRKK